MTYLRKVVPLVSVLMFCTQPLSAEPDHLTQWQQGLSGAYLTAYKGSVLGNSSSLTELWLCSTGRFIRKTDAGFYLPGQVTGASKGRITGTYGFKIIRGRVHLTYRTDQGQSGSFVLSLQRNGRVNMGGAAFAVKQGGAGC